MRIFLFLLAAAGGVTYSPMSSRVHQNFPDPHGYGREADAQLAICAELLHSANSRGAYLRRVEYVFNGQKSSCIYSLPSPAETPTNKTNQK